MTVDEEARLIGMLRRVVRDCGKLYGACAKLMVRRYPNQIDGLPQRFAEKMDDLHRGLLTKVYVTIVRADDRWSGPEKRVAAALIEHLWDQEFHGSELREVATNLFKVADDLTWEQLVSPFVRYAPLADSKAQVETIVMRLANLIAKCDGQLLAEEQIALHTLQRDLDAALYPASQQSNHSAANGTSTTLSGKYATEKESPAGGQTTGQAQHENQTVSPEQREERLSAAIEELDSLIGLTDVKQQVKSYANFLKLQNQRKSKGLSTMPISMHMSFVGNPGTGKTTVARIVGRILGSMGMLATGHVVETDRSGLVAQYAGQTAQKTNDLCDAAVGGVLFIDEAYSLVDQSGDDAYGREAIQSLLKRMEDQREQMAVILAGYSREMDSMMKSNPGLTSRVSTTIEFSDYCAADMGQIFEAMCNQNQYRLSAEARHCLLIGFDELFRQRDRHFGNGRTVRNVFEESVRRLADRIAGVAELTEELLTSLTVKDIAFPGISDAQLQKLRSRPHVLRIDCQGCQRKMRVQPQSLGATIKCSRCESIQKASWADVCDP